MGQLGPKRGQSEDLGYFLVQNALIFYRISNHDWEFWYLLPNGGKSASKILLALKVAQLGRRRGQNEVLDDFRVQNALVFTDSEYHDWKLWCLMPSGDESAPKIFVGPRMGQIRAKKRPKWGFRQFHVLNTLGFCQFCVLWDIMIYRWSKWEKKFRWP